MVDRLQASATATTLRPARESCEGCHWPAVNHDDKVRTKVHYDTDAKNTEVRTKLIVHTGGGEARDKATRGIHWHVEQDVEYVTDDEQKRTIPLGPDHVARTASRPPISMRQPGRPRRDGPEGQAEDGVCGLPQCGRPPVHESGGPVDDAMAKGASTRAFRRSRHARTRSSRSPPALTARDEQVPVFKQIIAEAAPKDVPASSRKTPRRSSRTRCSRS